jgi:hypothetical protein
MAEKACNLWLGEAASGRKIRGLAGRIDGRNALKGDADLHEFGGCLVQPVS